MHTVVFRAGHGCETLPTGASHERGAKRVIRGGSWNDNARNCRAAYRNGNEPDDRNDNLGFRVSRAQAQPA